MGSDILDNGVSQKISYTEIIQKNFPYYLALGMTYDEYFKDDPILTKYYREAFEIKRDIKNQELWLQGLYFYEALLDVSPLLQAFAKKGTKAHKYRDEPYIISEKKAREKEIEIEKAKQDELKEKLFKFADYHNKKMNDKSGG